MLVFAYIVGPGSGAPPFNFTIHGTAVITFHLPDLALQSVTNLPVTNAPQLLYNGGQIPWGIRSVRTADGTVCLDGTTKRSNLGPADVWVAMAPIAQVATASAWQYYTGLASPLDWSTDFTLAQPMSFTGSPSSDAAAPLGQLSVTQYGTKFLAAASSDVLDSRIRSWIADSPQGPWT